MVGNAQEKYVDRLQMGGSSGNRWTNIVQSANITFEFNLSNSINWREFTQIINPTVTLTFSEPRHVDIPPLTLTFSRGGYRIPRRRGHQPSGGGAPTYDFAKIGEKLHEIEKIMGHRGGMHRAHPS